MITGPLSSGVTPESLAFLQKRVASFGLLMGALGMAFLVMRVAIMLASGQAGMLVQPSTLLHLGGAGCLLALWALTRRGSLSRRTIHTIETVGLVASSFCYAAMGIFIPSILRPDMIVLLALALSLIARAIYVPSRARHTLLLACIIGPPLLLLAYQGYRHVDPAVLRVLSLKMGVPVRAEVYARNATIDLASWWAMVSLLATVTSRVVYGLRREVRQALRLGQYVLEEKLGEGGMGVVYRAGHAMLRRPTAVKLLLPGRSSETDVQRFEREVQLTARLTHPNTVTIFDYGRTADGIFYYAMELLDGAPLDAVVRHAGPLEPERVAHVVHEVAGALSEAHAIGLIHRDLKPANVILCARGGVHDVPKVVDFGLVKELGGSEGADLTRDDVLTGTPLYMSPEAIQAPDSVDARSDLYGLGAVSYYLLTGQPVFVGRSVVEVCADHLHSTPEPPSRRAGRDLPADLEAVVLTCLAKSPDERPQSADELRQRIEACACFGAWTAERAREWWREHGPALSARRSATRGPDDNPLGTLTRWPAPDAEEDRAARRAG